MSNGRVSSGGTNWIRTNLMARTRIDKTKNSPQVDAAADPMSRCAMCCQEGRWREAVLICNRITSGAETIDSKKTLQRLQGPFAKIEYSLRRQMAAALIQSARDLLAKEFLLDVGK